MILTEAPAPIELIPGLERSEVLRRLRAANDSVGFQHRILSFYLTDLCDRREFCLFGSPDIAHFADEQLGMERRRCNEYLQVGRQLLELPLVDEAFLGRRLCWSKVLALLPVAQVSSQDEWIDRAMGMAVRQLKKAVSQARQGRRPNGGDGEGLPRPAGRVDSLIGITELDRFEVFRAQLMRQHGRQVTTREVLEWLMWQVEPEPVPGEVTEEQRTACEDKPTPPWLRDEVISRDGYVCVHCERGGELHAHHLHFRSHGGRTIAANLTTTCAVCHGLIHAGLLRIEGTAPDALQFMDREGNPISRRAISKTVDADPGERSPAVPSGWGQIRSLDQDFPDEISMAWLNRHPDLEWHREGYVRVRLPAGIATASALDEAVSLQTTPGDVPDGQTVAWLCRHPQMNWEIGGAMQFFAAAAGATPDWPGRLVGQAQS